MTTFFAIVGFITVVVIIVNLTNSHSNTTNSNIVQNNINYRTSNRLERQRSLVRLSKNYDCPIEYLEETIINNLYLDKLNETELYLLIDNIRQNKMEEAKILNIHPDDTGSAIIENWIVKHLNNSIY